MLISFYIFKFLMSNVYFQIYVYIHLYIYVFVFRENILTQGTR